MPPAKRINTRTVVQGRRGMLADGNAKVSE